MSLIPIWARLLVLAGVVAFIWGHGYTTGKDRAEAKFASEAQETQKNLDAAQRAAQDAERARLSAVADRNRLAQEIARMAAQDPTGGNEAFSQQQLDWINRQ